MMYFLISFDINNHPSDLRYPLPRFLNVAALDDSFLLKDQIRVPFSKIEDSSDESLLQSWKAVIETVVGFISVSDDRALIFPSKDHLDLFHIIKHKNKLHTRSKGNAFFKRRMIADDALETYFNEEIISYNDMVSVVQALGQKTISEHPDYSLYWMPRKVPKNDMSEKQTSYIYMGDTRTYVFHEKKSECLKKIPKDSLRGLGKDPRKVGFTACLKCLREYVPPAITKTPKVDIPRRSSPVGKSKSEIMREQITALSEEYGMHAEFHGSMVYVTTIAGEWYFDYNDRPIKLRHKNAKKNLDRYGNLISHYHVQQYQFHAPLQVLAYIRNHEKAEIRRLMEMDTNIQANENI